MQGVVFDKPYQFVPPREGSFWPAVIARILPTYLERSHGIASVEFHGAERLRESLAAGHGVLLTPNHCRPCDPMVMGMLAREAGCNLFIMASAHLFIEGRVLPWLLPRIGAFSVYREGLDREALKTAVEILARGRRPLIVFPEGVITRTNDRLVNLQEGIAFIARSAAKKKAAAQGGSKVVVHPVAIRYKFGGDLRAAVTPVLDDIEQRLTWKPHAGEEPLARVARVKKLRSAIVTDMVGGELDEQEKARRWRQLADMDVAQQLSFYPPDYISDPPVPERLLETVERFEENLTGKARVHRPWRATMEVGEAVDVEPARERGKESDPLMQLVRTKLEEMLGITREHP